MGKKLKLKLIPFLSKNDPKLSPFPPWQWPSCTQTKTLSFRAVQDDIFNMVNETHDVNGFSTTISEAEPSSAGGRDPVEMVIRGLSSERLFFKSKETSSILEEANNKNDSKDKDIEGCNVLPYKECVAMTVDSEDPYGDFRVWMGEMVEVHGLKDWKGLEELLGWYLKANVKSNHGYILRAFADLLVSLSFAGESSSSFASSSFTISHSSPQSSPLSLPSSLSTATPCPCLSQLLQQGVDEKNDDEESNVSS